jgi:uncharacterized protein with ParB-like and HNH nuclease domain
MKSDNQTVRVILSSPNQYLVPVFQRYYRWDLPQWEKLWQNIVALQTPEKKGRHFLGFVVLVGEVPGSVEGNTFFLIDGQQRLTTLCLLLVALRNLAASRGHQDLANEITELYLIHPHRKGSECFRLLPKEPDRDTYVAAVTGKPVADGRIGRALSYFTERLYTIADPVSEAGLRAFLKIATTRLEFVYAILTDDNPYNIFKSLNSTGVPLGPADLIRNFVFMHVHPPDQDEFDGQDWQPLENNFRDASGTTNAELLSAFFRDYLMSEGRYVAPAQTFEEFEDRYSDTEFDPGELTATLGAYADHYTVIRGAKTDATSGVTEALVRLRELESSTTYPLLLNLFGRRARNEITGEELERAIRLLAGFILRRFVCNYGSRGYGRLFVSTCNSLGENAVDNLERYLVERGYPDTPRFEQAFVTFNLFERGYTRVILDALVRAYPHKENFIPANAQIEHIMPQTLTDQWRADLGGDWQGVYDTWLHTPGNLTLSAYNPNVGNSPFSVKRKEFERSNIAMTRDVAKHTSWGEAEIKSRGQQLARLAGGIWIGPASAPVMADSDPSQVGGIQEATRHVLRRRYWTALRGYLTQTGSSVTPPVPDLYDWRSFPIKVKGVSLWAIISLRHSRIGIGLTLRGSRRKSRFDALWSERETLETAMGGQLIFTELPDKSYSLIELYWPGANPANEAAWPQQHQWLREKLELVYSTLEPRIRAVGDR